MNDKEKINYVKNHGLTVGKLREAIRNCDDDLVVAIDTGDDIYAAMSAYPALLARNRRPDGKVNCDDIVAISLVVK